MDRPPLRYHCKDCGLNFDSGKSLDVHLQYHNENLLSKWGSSSTGEESNNNHVGVKPSKSPRVAAVPADSSDSAAERFSPGFNFPSVNRATPPVQQQQQFHYPPPADMRPPSSGDAAGGSRPGSNFTADAEPDYILGGGGGFPQQRSPAPSPVGSPAPHLLQTSSSLRFHPYQQQQPVYGHPDHRNGGVSSSSPVMIAAQQRCDKCGYACDGPTALLEHIQNVHAPSPPQGFNFGADFMRQHGGGQEVKDEPQAEILDLDSHKVHVYQPPVDENGESSQLDPAGMVPWLGALPPDKKLYPIHTVHGQLNGSGMPSPDFNVTTTTLGSPDLQHHHQPYRSPYDHHQINQQLPQHQITSSQLPLLTPKPTTQLQSKGSGNASWKSNEARRPKTYNCTACNKWFTSSGHLKRHYNTTLHKNAVKQSGIPDPAHHPVTNHHHPPKDPAPPYAPRHQDSPPTPPAVVAAVDENAHMMSVKMEEGNFERQQHAIANNGHNFLPNPPNSLAGPSEVTGGLLLHSTQFQAVPEEMRAEPTQQLMQQHQTFLPFPGAAHATYPQGMTMYPNSQPPHVSSIPIVTNSITGNLNALEQQAVEFQQIWGPNGELRSQLIALAAPSAGGVQLPGFAQFAPHSFAPFHQQTVQQFCGERLPEEQSAYEPNVGGLSPARVPSVDSFYPGPGDGFEIADVRSIDDGRLSPPGDTCDTDIGGGGLPDAEPSDFVETPYPSPDAGDDEPEAFAEDRKVFVKDHKVFTEDRGTFVREPAFAEDRKVFAVDHKVFTEDRGTFVREQAFAEDRKVFAVDHKVFTEDRGTFVREQAFVEEPCSVSSTVERCPTPPIRCDDCDKVFNKACYLTQHNKSFHNGARPHKCEKCGKRFEAESHLSEHLSKHAGDKPFKCEICPKQFNHKTDLRRHMCLHSGDKPFVCNVCGKGFIRKDHMIKHCDTHRRKHVLPPGLCADRLYSSAKAACDSPSPAMPPPPPPPPLQQVSH